MFAADIRCAGRLRAKATAALAAIVMVTAGCGSSAPTPVEPHVVDSDGTGSVAVPSTSPMFLADLAVVRSIPRDTEFLFAAESPDALIELARYQQLRRDFGGIFAKAGAELVEEFGADLLDPAALDAIGIDTVAPAGFAWLDSDAEAICVFFGVRDEAAFDAYLRRLGAMHDMSWSPRPASSGGVVWQDPNDEELAVFVKEGLARVLYVDRRKHASRVMRQMGSLTLADSLAQDPRFSRTVEVGMSGPGPVHAAGYVGVHHIIDHLAGELPAGRLPLVGSVDGIAFRMTGVGSSIEMEAVVETKDKSIFRALQAQPGKVPVVLRGASPQSALALGGFVPRAEIGRWVEEMLSFERRPERARKEIEDELNLSLDRDIIPALTGEVGVVVDIDPDERDWMRPIATVAVGVEPKYQDRLVRAVRDASRGELVVDAIGDYVVMSEQKAGVDRIRKAGSTVVMPKGLDGGAVVEPGAVAMMRLDAVVVGATLFGFSYRDHGFVGMPQPPESLPNMSPREREIERELEKLSEQEDEIWAASSRRNREMMSSITKSFGTTLMRVDVDGSRLRVRAAQRMDGTDLADVITRAFRLAVRNEKQEEEDMKRMDELNAKRHKLFAERDRLRDKSQGVAVPIP